MFIVNSKSGESFELRRDEASKMLKWRSAVSRVSNTLLIKHLERLFSPECCKLSPYYYLLLAFKIFLWENIIIALVFVLCHFSEKVIIT